MDMTQASSFPEVHNPLTLSLSTRCLVCAGDILEDAVECDDCDTPYHRDCFAYNEKCAVLACGGLCCHAQPPANEVLEPVPVAAIRPTNALDQVRGFLQAILAYVQGA
jgi:hypothetical protein